MKTAVNELFFTDLRSELRYAALRHLRFCTIKESAAPITFFVFTLPVFALVWESGTWLSWVGPGTLLALPGLNGSVFTFSICIKG